MADAGDIGKMNMDLAEGFSVAAIRARIADRESAAECEDCGIAIPEKRRLAARGCTRCVRCQEAFETAQ